MEQTKPSPLSPSRRLVIVGYAAAITLVLLAAIQYHTTATPNFVYTLQLAIPALMLGYGLLTTGYYLRWRHQIKRIRHSLRAKSIVKDKFAAITTEEARAQYREAKKRFEETQRLMEVAANADILHEDKRRIRDLLANDRLDEVESTIPEAIDRKDLYDKAEKAHCLAMAIKFLKPNDFQPEAVETIISEASRLRREARECGVEDKVIPMLEFNNMEKAKELIRKARQHG